MPATSSGAIPVIIDTDTAQDDCVTILAGILDPAADVRAITMVAGNVGFDRQFVNAQLTLNAVGALGQVPVYLGSRRPMVRQWVSAEDVHGDGTGGLAMDVTGLDPEREHAVDALIRLTAEAPGEISIVCIGPLTNIAMAVVKDPRFVANVKALYIMGGSNNGRGNITPSAEFNFYVDPHAAQVVLDAGFENIVIVPWAPVTIEQALFSRERFDEISALGTTLAAFYHRICLATLEFDEAAGIPGSTHPDSLTLSVLLHPELIISQAPYRVDVETSSALTLGFSAMAWGRYGLPPNATVVERIDSEAFFQLIRGYMAIETTPSRPFQNL